MRMTNISKENIRIADTIQIEPNDTKTGYFAVAVKSGNRAYVASKDAPVLYPTPTHAYKAVRRINSSVPVSNL